MYKRKRQLKKLYQGITDEDCWNLHIFLARIIVQGLQRFQKVNIHTYPSDCENIEMWHLKIDEMIWSFHQVASGYDKSPISQWSKSHTQRGIKMPIEILDKDRDYQQKVQGGIDLFSKYFTDLWD